VLASARIRWTWLLCLAALACGSPTPVGLGSVSSTLYVRTDTNATTVWSPRQRIAGKIGDTAGVEAALTVDSWTGASIDVTTAATKAVSEVRKEITASAYYAFPNATLSGGYRYSTENDYWSNGGVGTLAFDLANNNTQLALTAFGSKDIVGRSGDAFFRKPQSSLGARLGLTQVIDRKSLVQLSLEIARVTGYQSSPYRFVAVGGDGTCAGFAAYCLPEQVPSERLRAALVARARRALSDTLSAGIEYRLYHDDWGLWSHTIAPDLALLVGAHCTLTFSYRYYTQGEASFYRPRYLLSGGADMPAFLTRDRELSALYSNRLGLGYLHSFPLGEDGSHFLTAALRGGVTRYTYLAFVGLTHVDALESTFLLSLDWQ